jgi:hypothetical protein
MRDVKCGFCGSSFCSFVILGLRLLVCVLEGGLSAVCSGWECQCGLCTLYTVLSDIGCFSPRFLDYLALCKNEYRLSPA